MTTYDQSAQRRNPAFWVPTLYFAEGLPFAVVATVATYLYQSRGLSNEKIAFYTGLLLTPWSLKPFWSPLLEMFRTKKFWVVTMQLLAGAGTALIALSLPLPSYLGYSLALLAVVAICSSTHDIAADGLYLSSLSASEVSRWAGWQGAFWNAGNIFAGGALVWVAGRLEKLYGVTQAWMAIFLALGVMLAALGLYHARMLPSGEAAKSVATLLKTTSRTPLALYGGLLVVLGMVAWASALLQANIGVLGSWLLTCSGIAIFLALAYRVAAWVRRGRQAVEPEDGIETLSDVIVTFLQKPHIYLFMAFVFLYRAGEGQVSRIMPLFLLGEPSTGGMGLSRETVGLVYSTFGTVAFIVGSILGGYYAARVGLKKGLFVLCAVLNFPNIAYVYLSVFLPTSIYAISAAVLVEKFGYGFGFVGVIVLMMQEIAPGKYQTAHYAFASALMNVGLQLPAILSGWIQERLGYRNFFIWVLVCGVPGLIMAKLLPIRGKDASMAAAAPDPEPAQA